MELLLAAHFTIPLFVCHFCLNAKKGFVSLWWISWPNVQEFCPQGNIAQSPDLWYNRGNWLPGCQGALEA
jgi:hypothetical protein